MSTERKHTCQDCGGRISYPAHDYGTTVPCPHCGTQTSLGEKYASTAPPAKAVRSQQPPALPTVQTASRRGTKRLVLIGSFIVFMVGASVSIAFFVRHILAVKAAEQAAARAAAEATAARATAEAAARRAAAAREQAEAEAHAEARARAITTVVREIAGDTNRLVELKEHGFVSVSAVNAYGVRVRDIEKGASTQIHWSKLSEQEVINVLQTAIGYKALTVANLLTPLSPSSPEFGNKLDEIWRSETNLVGKIRMRFNVMDRMRDYNGTTLGVGYLARAAAVAAADAREAEWLADGANHVMNWATNGGYENYLARNDFRDQSGQRINWEPIFKKNQIEANSVADMARNRASRAEYEAAAVKARAGTAKEALTSLGFEAVDNGIRMGSNVVTTIPSFVATQEINNYLGELRMNPEAEAERQASLARRAKYLEAVAGRQALAVKAAADQEAAEKVKHEQAARENFSLIVAAMRRTGFAEEQITRAVAQGGAIVKWGAYDKEPISFPQGLSGVVAVATGQRHTVALRQNGTVLSLDFKGFGVAPIPAGLRDIVALSAGGVHTLALQKDGTVAAWDSKGQRKVPPSDIGRAIAIAAGTSHDVALRQNGTVAAWGADTYGQARVPAGLSAVVAIAAGGFHNIAVHQDGRLTVWGANDYDQTIVPATLGEVVSVAAGERHSVALRRDGTVMAWGDNREGQTRVPDGLANVVAIAAGARHTVALRKDGTVVAWGSNSHGQTSVPVGLTGVVAIAAGSTHTVAIRLE